MITYIYQFIIKLRENSKWDEFYYFREDFRNRRKIFSTL